jgi:hypothetical protein
MYSDVSSAHVTVPELRSACISESELYVFTKNNISYLPKNRNRLQYKKQKPPGAGGFALRENDV